MYEVMLFETSNGIQKVHTNFHSDICLTGTFSDDTVLPVSWLWKLVLWLSWSHISIADVCPACTFAL